MPQHPFLDPGPDDWGCGHALRPACETSRSVTSRIPLPPSSRAPILPAVRCGLMSRGWGSCGGSVLVGFGLRAGNDIVVATMSS